jgi:hypothetical protein
MDRNRRYQATDGDQQKGKACAMHGPSASADFCEQLLKHGFELETKQYLGAQYQ